MTPALVLQAQNVLTPEGLRPATVHLADGKILKLSSFEDLHEGIPTESFDTAVIMPGLVDTHVHINEPGRTEWEGFETATRAAAAGGITTVVDMPLNCIPVTTTLSALNEKLAATHGLLSVDCGFYGGVTPGNAPELAPMIRAGVLGFKAFLVHSGIDDFPNATEADLREAMPILAEHGVPLLVHAELECSHTSPPGDPTRYRTYLDSRPGEWELEAIRLMIRLAKEFHCPVHIVHLSCGDAVPLIAEAKAQGVPITVETCPHYLVFEAEKIPDGDTRYKCAPPIREASNREKLWQGLKEGVIDFIISDHSPCTPVLKKLETGNFEEAWGGISSLQFGLSSIWTEAEARGFSLQDITRWMSENPAARVGLFGQKGTLAPGADADIVIWEPGTSMHIDRSAIQHRHKETPYEGRILKGRVCRTYLRGQEIYRHDTGSVPTFSETPRGQHLLRAATGVPA